MAALELRREEVGRGVGEGDAGSVFGSPTGDAGTSDGDITDVCGCEMDILVSIFAAADARPFLITERRTIDDTCFRCSSPMSALILTSAQQSARF